MKYTPYLEDIYGDEVFVSVRSGCIEINTVQDHLTLTIETLRIIMTDCERILKERNENF